MKTEACLNDNVIYHNGAKIIVSINEKGTKIATRKYKNGLELSIADTHFDFEFEIKYQGIVLKPLTVITEENDAVDEIKNYDDKKLAALINLLADYGTQENSETAIKIKEKLGENHSEKSLNIRQISFFKKIMDRVLGHSHQ